MNIAVVSFAYVKANELRRMVHTAGSGSQRHPVRFYIPVHSRQEDVIAVCHELADQHNVEIIMHGYNRGLARSINDVMVQVYDAGADVLINSNDDVVWGTDSLVELALAAKQLSKTHYAVNTSGWNGENIERENLHYCAIAFTPLAFEKLGCFDENCFPAYWEDTDYEHRAKLLGLPSKTLNLNVYHGSSYLSINHPLNKANHDEQFTKTQSYFVRKWGQDLQFSTPFDSGLPLYINPDERHHPYADFDRLDLPEL